MSKVHAIAQAVRRARTLDEARTETQRLSADHRRRVTPTARTEIVRMKARGLSTGEIQRALIAKSGLRLSGPTIRKVLRESAQ